MHQLITHIRSLEKLSNPKRGEYIKEQLEKWNIPFTTQDFRTQIGFKGKNIIVDYPFGEKNTKKKVLLTAHFNKWLSSPGANDNASGVSVLLELINTLKKERLNKSLRFVFFDHEDGVGIIAGSKNYVKHFGTNDIDCVYNIDGAGIGDMIVLAPSQNTPEFSWQTRIKSAAQKEKVTIAGVPFGQIIFWKYPKIRLLSDQVAFWDAGFTKAVQVSAFCEKDLWMSDLVKQGKLLEIGARILLGRYFPYLGVKLPEVFKHHHNSLDRSEFINQDILQKVYKVMLRTINN